MILIYDRDGNVLDVIIGGIGQNQQLEYGQDENDRQHASVPENLQELLLDDIGYGSHQSSLDLKFRMLMPKNKAHMTANTTVCCQT